MSFVLYKDWLKTATKKRNEYLYKAKENHGDLEIVSVDDAVKLSNKKLKKHDNILKEYVDPGKKSFDWLLDSGETKEQFENFVSI